MAITYVAAGAKLFCTNGKTMSTLGVSQARRVRIGGGPQANITDSKTGVNIRSFGTCLRPNTLNPPPCAPACGNWIGGKEDVRVEGQPAVVSVSVLSCSSGNGIITVVTDGQ